MKPIIRGRAVSFLHENKISKKSENEVNNKIRKQANCNVGKKLGITSNTKISDIPLTGYDYYKSFFMNPHEGDFIYPLKEYVRATTSGTMSKPKTFLLPQKGILENIKKIGLSTLFICTYDGDRYHMDLGDTLYVNIPGGTFFAAHLHSIFKKNQSSLLKLVPPSVENLSYKDKVDYFIKNHASVDVAYMLVTTLLDMIVDNVDEEIRLKGFYTQDMSAGPLKEEIKKKIGVYPSTIFASTETMIIGAPSMQYPGSFFFDWRVNFPEFIPENEAVNVNFDVMHEHPETVPMMEVEPGKRYQLVVTPLHTDLTRYVMPDILECVAMGDDVLGLGAPLFKYYARSDKIIVLHNFTRINEEELLTVLTNAEIPFVDFTSRRELDHSREYLALYIELSKDMPIEEVHKKITEGLKEFDWDWRDLTDFMEYDPLRLNLLPKGSFSRFLEQKSGMARVTRMEMREERFKQLLGKTD